jgi:lipid II:glycine glycyltransferase (peptidoglycan interpeptide bridge formation enzyme)
VDLVGARRPPISGEPMYGLYEHKRSFGATWVELTGAHERAIRPRRYALGRALSRVVRLTQGRGVAR